jgi:hypothetical protein
MRRLDRKPLYQDEQVTIGRDQNRSVRFGPGQVGRRTGLQAD